MPHIAASSVRIDGNTWIVLPNHVVSGLSRSLDLVHAIARAKGSIQHTGWIHY